MMTNNNYNKGPKLRVIIDDDTHGGVEVPTQDYVVGALKSTKTTLESSIASLEENIDVKIKDQAEAFKCELEERDNKIKHLVNELNEMSKLNMHLIKHGSKTAHCEIISYQDTPLSIFKSLDDINYKIKFNFVNDSYKYDEYEFKLDSLTGSNIRLHLCKLKNIGKDRIKVKIKIYDSSNNLIKKLKYIVDIKGKKYIQL